MTKYFKTVFTITYLTDGTPVPWHDALEEELANEMRITSGTVSRLSKLESVELSGPQVIETLKALGFEAAETAEEKFNLDANGKPLPE
jgi:hypothetical protein